MSNPALAKPPAIIQHNECAEHTENHPNSHIVNYDLEHEADLLLSKSIIFSNESGIYTQAQLDRKMRNERKRLRKFEEYGVSDEVINHLVERQVEDLIYAANLTAFQEIIYRLFVSGFGSRRIATALGIKQRTIEQRLRTIKRKIRAAYEEGRYAGWYEVYLSEVNRPVYHAHR